jgi:hypothetical protein
LLRIEGCHFLLLRHALDYAAAASDTPSHAFFTLSPPPSASAAIRFAAACAPDAATPLRHCRCRWRQLTLRYFRFHYAFSFFDAARPLMPFLIIDY